MNPKTMLSCLRGRSGRHRLTIPNHTIKALARKLAFEAQRAVYDKFNGFAAVAGCRLGVDF